MNKNYSSKLPETYKFPLYLFYQGKNCEAYKFFGVHEVEKDNKKCNNEITKNSERNCKKALKNTRK